ncbi:hypothetical protein BD413DRAFT_2962 [Trametes elegans]|nr:hypothetical protein BD413DRAFT_2962 [Trametes elegans]
MSYSPSAPSHPLRLHTTIFDRALGHMIMHYAFFLLLLPPPCPAMLLGGPRGGLHLLCTYYPLPPFSVILVSVCLYSINHVARARILALRILTALEPHYHLLLHSRIRPKSTSLYRSPSPQCTMLLQSQISYTFQVSWCKVQHRRNQGHIKVKTPILCERIPLQG